MDSPRIFYCCFAHDEPRGGVKVIYRHVDVLRRAGFEAYVFHPRERFRARWFANDTPVVGPAGLAKRLETGRDFMVLPEDLVTQEAAEPLLELPCPKVIFNQNVYYGFAGFGPRVPRRYPYRRRDVRAVFTVSPHNAELLRLAYPELAVHRIRLGVDPKRFAFRELSTKRRQIALVAKAPLPSWTVRHVLESRARDGHGPLRRYRWRVLQGLSERALAAALGDALVLVSLGIEEGFGLLPLEAMLSGCLVAAAASGPPDEYLPKAYRFAPGDLASVVRWIERVAHDFEARPSSLAALTRDGLARASAFTPAAEERSVLDAWAAVLRSRRRART